MPKTAIFATSQNDSCPECGAKLAIRRGRHSPFLGCSHCPECLHIRPLKAQVHSHIVKVLDGQSCQKCPEMLALRQGRYGMFIGCYNYPKCDHTELIDKPDETSITCPQCRQGKLLRRMSRYGKVFYSCGYLVVATGFPQSLLAQQRINPFAVHFSISNG